MAMSFSQVKTINIPEGSVTKITDSNGNTLWQSVGWHTIWEGNKTCSIKVSGSANPIYSGNENNFAQTVSGTGYTPKLRITFSYSRTDINDYYFKSNFIINGLWKTTDPSSPLTIEAVSNSNNEVTLCAPAYDSSSPFAYAGIQKKRDTTNNRIILNLIVKASSSINTYNVYFTINFTVTKIEQYY